MTIIPVGYCQTNLRFTGSAVPRGAEMTFGHILNDEGDPEAVAEAVFDALAASEINTNMASTITLSEILVKFGPNSTGPSFQRPTELTGEESGQSNPPNVSVLIRKFTALGGRAGRGRMYWPGIPDSYVGTGGQVTLDFLTANGPRWESFRGDIQDAGYPLVVLHGQGSPITLPTPITSLAVDATAATQRRRLR